MLLDKLAEILHVCLESVFSVTTYYTLCGHSGGLLVFAGHVYNSAN